MNNNEITLNIIKKSNKSLSAYQILDKFQKTKKVQPTTVYRSLDFLIKKGIIHKSNINKNYMMCKNYHHHKHDQNTLLAICKQCGKTEELLKEVFLPMIKISKLKKFDLSFFDLEILTKCKICK
jgi:Fur family zinc uptake transcriptional regulator